MPQPIERIETKIVGDFIEHDDRPVTWERVDALCGKRADRRKSWAIIEGEACTLVKWTDRCSGCDGGGCHECGYHGVTRRAQWCPWYDEIDD